MHKMNRLMTTIIILALMLLFTNCYEEEPNTTSSEGEKVFYNGNIYTVDPNQPTAEAMFVKDGVIQYVGDNAEALNRATDDAEQIDLGGAFVMPGIHDVHMHPLEASSENIQFTVDDNVLDPEDYAADVETALQQNPGDGWLLI
jgi:predicted amidohydrolase YtcJ